MPVSPGRQRMEAASDRAYRGRWDFQRTIKPSEQKAENPAKSAESEAAKEQAAASDNKKAPGFGIILSGAGILLSRAYLRRK